ncbi:hypothetical protein EDB89DRAFT_1913287 [Lactarius sanguifluus]|nr:hypothetical protein EDB89DRAFT_1913287 [Lactarius sanguifluus]
MSIGNILLCACGESVLKHTLDHQLALVTASAVGLSAAHPRVLQRAALIEVDVSMKFSGVQRRARPLARQISVEPKWLISRIPGGAALARGLSGFRGTRPLTG